MCLGCGRPHRRGLFHCDNILGQQNTQLKWLQEQLGQVAQRHDSVLLVTEEPTVLLPLMAGTPHRKGTEGLGDPCPNGLCSLQEQSQSRAQLHSLCPTTPPLLTLSVTPAPFQNVLSELLSIPPRGAIYREHL